jgi:hypothetical protein
LEQLVTLHRRTADACPSEDSECLSKICSASTLGDVSLGTQSRDLLGHSDIDELIERDTFRLGELARLVEKRGLKS